MYKITLYDECCCPISDDIYNFYVENLEEFERKWLPLEVERNIDTISRYYESKGGKIVTDYFSDDPKLNIIQNINYEEIEKLNYQCNNINIELVNFYGCKTIVNFNTIKINLVKAKIDNKYFLLGQYEGIGGKRIETIYNRWYKKETKYCQMHFYGNPIAIYKERYINWEDIKKEDAYKDFYTNDINFFKDEVVKTFVWLPVKEVDEEYKLEKLNDEQLAILLRDIVGEAG